jgi:hypothetical protein
VVGLWKQSLSSVNKKAADSLADPTEYENLFPGLRDTFKAQQFFAATNKGPLAASALPSQTVSNGSLLERLFFFFNLLDKSFNRSKADTISKVDFYACIIFETLLIMSICRSKCVTIEEKKNLLTDECE